MKSEIKNIVRNFKIRGKLLSAKPHGSGHINDTYLVDLVEDRSVKRYILQRINHHVFLDPEGMMRNIELVTTHLGQKIEELGGDTQRETLSLIPTNDGKSYLLTSEGEYWRGYQFIEKASTFEFADNPDQVYQAANAFGKFQERLSDYPVGQLVETIPNFHNTRKRYESFIAALQDDEMNRAHMVKAEIDFLIQREEQASILVDLLEKDQLPRRITHNDTKLNNVMIDDQTGIGVCVIDLDTVMPGSSLYDYGDGIRYVANTAAEDERDLSMVHFDNQYFEFFTKGYLDAVGDMLTPLELNYLPDSAILLTLECGMRFLTDYLQGDRYFKVSRSEQNLDRCRTQFKLVADMEAQIGDMHRVVEKHISGKQARV